MVVFVTCSGPRQRPDTWDHGSHPGQHWGAAEVDALSALWRVPASEHRGAPQHAQLASVSAGRVRWRFTIFWFLCFPHLKSSHWFFLEIYINQQSLNSSLRLSYLLPGWAAPGGSSDKHTNHSWLLFPAGVWPSAVSRPWSTEIACNTRYCILVVVRLSNLVVVFVIILGICCLSAGYEHVQQRSGVRAVRTSNEPVWLARGGCGRG